MKALEGLSVFARAYPDDAGVLVLLGNANRNLGRVNEAKAYLERAVLLAPDVAPVRTQLAVSHLDVGEEDAAIAELESASESPSEALVAGSLLVLTHLASHDLDSALAAAQRLAKDHPRSPAALNTLAVAHEARGELEDARANLRRAIEIDSSFLTATLNLARLERQTGSSGEATRLYGVVLELRPEHPVALVALARMASDAGRIRETVELLKRAQRHNPNAVAPRLVLAAYHLRRGETELALDLANEAKQINPASPRVAITMGRALLAAGDPMGAVREFEGVVERFPRVPGVLLELSVAYRRIGELPRARATLELLLEFEPDHFLASAGLGSIALLTGDGAAAGEMARKLVRLRPDNAAGHLLLAQAAMAEGDSDLAVTSFDRAFETAPSRIVVDKRHRGLMDMGRTSLAIQHLRDWLREHGADPARRLKLATALEAAGRAQEAIIEYERLLFEDENNPVALNNLALLYQGRDDAKAVDLAQRAYAAVPNAPAIADTLGWILVHTGEVEEGMRLLDRALASETGDPDIRYHYAAGLEKLGRRSEARTALTALLRSDASFVSRAEAVALLARLN